MSSSSVVCHTVVVFAGLESSEVLAELQFHYSNKGQERDAQVDTGRLLTSGSCRGERTGG